jgi:guanylate kinase
MPEAVLLFIAPPEPAELRRRLVGRGADSETAISERLRTAELELDAQEEFQHVIVNDDLDTAIEELEGVVRTQLDSRSDD